SEAARAISDLRHARGAVEYTRWEAQHAPRWRDRRAAAKQAAKWSEREADAGHRWQTHGVPEIARLEGHIQQLENNISELVTRADKQRLAQRAITDRLVQSCHKDIDLTQAVTAYQDHLDGIQPPAPRGVVRAAHHEHTHPPTIQPSPKPPQLGIGM